MPSLKSTLLADRVSVRLIVTGATDDDGRAMAVSATSASRRVRCRRTRRAGAHDVTSACTEVPSLDRTSYVKTVQVSFS